MTIGIPKEIKPDEYRVSLLPAAVQELAERGSTVIVQKDAGAGIGIADEVYRKAGARIVETAAALYAQSELVIKVKEPQPQEVALLRSGQVLFCYLHLAADRELTDGLLKSGITGIAFETVRDDHGRLPLLAPMSQVAGRLAVQVAAQCLEKHVGGPGYLLGGVAGVPARRVVVLGGGVSGTEAIRMALGLGAEVTVLERRGDRLAELDLMFQGRVRTRYSSIDAVEEEVAAADVVIGTVLIPGASAPRLVSRKLVSRMRPGSVIVDVSIDQGGCCETSRPTIHSKPTYVEEGVIHCCVTNLPGAVARTSSHALSNAIQPYALTLATQGEAAWMSGSLRSGLQILDGKLVAPEVASSLGMPCEPVARELAGVK